MFQVKISEKGGQQSNYDFDKPEVTIGRMKGNDIVLPKGNVSKKHARIYGRNGSLMIDDLNSTNGTYVNGRKVTNEHEVTENDKIYIGDFILQVQPERQSGPPQAPPQPPGGGDDRSSSQQPAASQSGGMSPPSPPGAGGPNGQSGPNGGGRGGGNEALSSLDEKYGGKSNGSAPSRRPSQPTGDSGGRPSQSQLGGNSGGGGRPSRSTPGSPSGGPGDDGRRSRSATRRDQAVRGSSAGGPDTGGPQRNQDDSAPPSPGSKPGPGSTSGPGASSGPGSTSSGGSLGPSSSATSDRAGSEPKSSPGRRSPDGNRSGASGLGRSDSLSRSDDAAGSPAPPDDPRKRRGSRDRLAQDLRGDRRAEGPVGQPSLPAELQSEFDENFQDAQIAVVEELFKEIDIDDLPLSYPPEEEDSEKYRELVSEAVKSVKPRRVDREVLTDLIVSECVGLGPLEEYLDDPDVQNVYVNHWDRIVVRRDRDVVLAEHAFSDPAFLDAATHRLMGTREPEVITDEIRFGDGTRVHVMMPPVTVDGPVLTVRKPPTSHPSLDDLVDDGVMSAGMRDFLERAVETGRSILVAGPTSSGKTTLLETLGRSVPDGSRIVIVEETSQLELPQEGVVRLEARPGSGFDLEGVLEAAIGMHPERILLDECRGAEAYTWVSAAASGTEGSMATVHGINAADALGRLESLCLLGSGDISPRGLREQIARAVDLVVIINRANDGGFRVQQVTEVQGVDLDAFRLNDIFYYRMEGTSGAFHPTGYIPLFYEDLRHLGVDVDLDIFRE